MGSVGDVGGAPAMNLVRFIWWQQFFQDLKLQFPGLSRSWNFEENPGLSRRRGNPVRLIL